MTAYTTNPDVPGKMFFRCDRMRATLSTEACTAMWRKANDLNDGNCAGCMRCPLGAVHAGEVAASMSPLKGTLTCARCHRGSTRLIGGHLCPSCYNRAREKKYGKNGKGTAPVKIGSIEPRRIRIKHGDEIRVVKYAETIDTMEMVVAALRDSRRKVVFAFNCEAPIALIQSRLW